MASILGIFDFVAVPGETRCWLCLQYGISVRRFSYLAKVNVDYVYSMVYLFGYFHIL